jgi:hypothetical protein
MTRIREETNTVDSLDVALLTSLNLAREVVGARSADGEGPVGAPESKRLKSLIELVESVGAGSGSPSSGRSGSLRGQGSETPLLTLPTGDELDGMEGDLLGPVDSASMIKAEEAGRG